MAGNVNRGIMFQLLTEVGPKAGDAFAAMKREVDALQKSMSGLKLNINVGGGTGPGGAGSPGGTRGGSSSPDKVAQAREKAAERGFLLESKWNRMAEAAVEKRAKDEARAVEKRGKEEAKVADRVRKQREKDLADSIKSDKKFWDDAIKQAKAGAEARAAAIAAADKNRAAGFGRLSAIGGDALRTGKKVGAGMDALSEMGRDAMRRADPFGEGLRRMGEDRKATTGWAGLSAIGRDSPEKFAEARKREAAESKKADREAKLALAERREAQARVTEGLNASLDSVMRLTRGFAQLGLVGETDMHKILDTMLGVQGAIDTVRGGIDSFRSIRGGLQAMNSLRGMGGAGGAAAKAAGVARGAGAFAGMAGTMGSAAGATGAAGAGAAALPVVAIAGIATAAAVTAFAALRPKVAGNFIARHGESAMGAQLALIGSLHAPESGVTNRQKERHREGVLDRIVGAQASVGLDALGLARSVMAGRRTERLTRERDEDVGLNEESRQNREYIDQLQEPLFARKREAAARFQEQQYGLRTSAMQSRGELAGQHLAGAFGRQQTAHGEQLALSQQRALGQFVDPAQSARAAAEQSREEKEVARQSKAQRENLSTQQAASSRRGRDLGQDLYRARANYAAQNTESGRASADAEVQNAQERLTQNAKERLQIQDRIRHVGIEGAQRELQLREQSLANAKQTADALRGQRQSATERFGQLLPSQQRAVHAASQALEQARRTGSHVARHHLDTARQFPELFGADIRQQDMANANRGGYRELERRSGLGNEIAGAEAEERRLAGSGGGLVDKLRNDLTNTANEAAEENAKAMAGTFNQLFERAMEHMRTETEKQIEATVNAMIRRERGQGRVAAG